MFNNSKAVVNLKLKWQPLSNITMTTNAAVFKLKAVVWIGVRMGLSVRLEGQGFKSLVSEWV